MKRYSKFGLRMVAWAGFTGALLGAETKIIYTTNTSPPLNYSAAYSVDNFSSNAVTSALSAQSVLLKELWQEHQRRAAELNQKNQGEKAKWETELVAELQEKSARLQKSLDSTMQPRGGTNELTTVAGEVEPQLVFISSVEARLEQLRAELDTALEDGRLWGMRIGTNKSPEELAGLTLGLVENQKVVKELQRQHLELELRKLEFQALWKMLQK